MLKRDRSELRRILDNLERAQAYLREERTLVCTRKSAATTTLDFTNPRGEICVAIDTEIGSPLAMLHTGIRDLRSMLDVDPKETRP